MIKLTSKQKELLKQYDQLAAQRSETIQQSNAAKIDSDAFASQLNTQRASSDGGAAAIERLRRATSKFDQAEKRCQELALVLDDLNEKIVGLDSALEADLMSVRKQLMAEVMERYDAAAQVFLAVCQHFVAFNNQLGSPLPAGIEMNLRIPRLTEPGGDILATYPLMEQERQGSSWFKKPVWNSVAQEQVNELKHLVDVAAKVASESKVARSKKQEAAIAKQQQDVVDKQKNPYSNARHL